MNVREISQQMIEAINGKVNEMLGGIEMTMKVNVPFNQVPQDAIDELQKLRDYLAGAHPIIERLTLAQAKAIKANQRQIIQPGVN